MKSKAKLKRLGLKQRYIAEKLGIKETLLSTFLNYEDEIAKIKRYIKGLK